MYRQIRVHEQDCLYQHILWWRSHAEEVREYELYTVTYGLSAAPFLAIRCLHQLQQEDGAYYPLTKNVLTSSTYDDNIFIGADSVEEVFELQRQVVALLSRGGFDLKKWASNCAAILEGIPLEDCSTSPLFSPDDNAVKVLGIHWDPIQDTFGYHSNIERTHPIKRTVLSIIARLYGPIGALGLVIF